MKIYDVRIILFVLIANVASGQPVHILWPAVKDSANVVDTHSRLVQYQNEGVFFPGNNGVGLRNDFLCARMNGVSEINDSTIQVLIEPENFPVNDSPWYAFKIWGATTDSVYIQLRYRHGKHRYPPKLSRDGVHWKRIADRDLSGVPGDTSALFRVGVSPDTLWVAAQEIMSSEFADRWEEQLVQKPFINQYPLGYSTLGKPLMAMTMAEGEGKNLLVILSRQHPPEITGFMEMLRFVETLAGERKIARRFRKSFEVIVMPVMNPDGVDHGHWRHNAGGVDLNRDWRFFIQPETYALRKFVLHEIQDRHLKIRYGVDFHSTQSDIFYTPAPSTLPSGKGITELWLRAVNKKFPDHPFSPEPSATEGPFSKNWFLYELKSEAITYEVGDNTDRQIIKERGEISAIRLMKILLKEYKK